MLFLKSFTFVIIFIFRSSLAQATCQTLRFISVSPVGSSAEEPCDWNIDSQKCRIQRGYSKFGKVQLNQNKTAYTLTSAIFDPNNPEDYGLQIFYNFLLSNRPAILEMNAYRILARKIAQLRDICEPNYIYAGNVKYFDMGPAFVDSTYFSVDQNQTITSNFLILEDQKIGPIQLITKETLARNHYLDITVAHELAHGLMQDLYGVENFNQVYKKFLSREGHTASLVTDPSMAWVEGFAEGFEAYLGEKYISQHLLHPTKLLDLARQTAKRIHTWNKKGWLEFLKGLPTNVYEILSSFSEIDALLVDFLKAERQRPIWENHYITYGNLANLAHIEEIFTPPIAADLGETMNWDVVSDEMAFSKEGIVAHLIYKILKFELAEDAFTIIYDHHPQNVHDFVIALLKNLPEKKLDLLWPTLKACFTLHGRELTRNFIKEVYQEEKNLQNSGALLFKKIKNHQEHYEKLMAEEVLKFTTLLPLRDFWIEFKGFGKLRKYGLGLLDRINIVTATNSRIEEFLHTIALSEDKEISKKVQPDVLNVWLRVRALLNPDDTIETFHKNLAAEIQFYIDTRQIDTAIAINRSRDALQKARQCFLSNCMSNPKTFYSNR